MFKHNDYNDFELNIMVLPGQNEKKFLVYNYWYQNVVLRCGLTIKAC